MRLFIFLTLCYVCFATESPSTDVSKAAMANTKFGLDLLKKVGVGNKNVFFSPYSISAAIAMTSLGAAGKTLKEIEDTCYFNLVNTVADPKAIHKVYKGLIEEYNKANQNYSLSTANRLFGAKNFEIKPTFKNETNYYYHAELEQLNFDGTAEGKINKWVENQTHDKIKDLFKAGSLSSDTVLVLVNAIYFKGNWDSQFKKDLTKDEQFHSADNTDSTVKMMNQKSRFGYYYDSDLKVKVLEMPYVGKTLSMVILLPDARDGLPALIQDLTADKFQTLISNVYETQVEVKLPKFKLETEYSLKETLADLGIKDLFSDRANFDEISKTPTKVAKVIHKAFIQTDEEGTEAAGATGIMNVVRMAVYHKYEIFYVNHPVLIAIQNKISNLVLFYGLLNKHDRKSKIKTLKKE